MVHHYFVRWPFIEVFLSRLSLYVDLLIFSFKTPIELPTGSALRCALKSQIEIYASVVRLDGCVIIYNLYAGSLVVQSHSYGGTRQAGHSDPTRAILPAL